MLPPRRAARSGSRVPAGGGGGRGGGLLGRGALLRARAGGGCQPRPAPALTSAGEWSRVCKVWLRTPQRHLAPALPPPPALPGGGSPPRHQQPLPRLPEPDSAAEGPGADLALPGLRGKPSAGGPSRPRKSSGEQALARGSAPLGGPAGLGGAGPKGLGLCAWETGITSSPVSSWRVRAALKGAPPTQPELTATPQNALCPGALLAHCHKVWWWSSLAALKGGWAHWNRLWSCLCLSCPPPPSNVAWQVPCVTSQEADPFYCPWTILHGPSECLCPSCHASPSWPRCPWQRSPGAKAALPFLPFFLLLDSQVAPTYGARH